MLCCGAGSVFGKLGDHYLFGSSKDEIVIFAHGLYLSKSFNVPVGTQMNFLIEHNRIYNFLEMQWNYYGSGSGNYAARETKSAGDSCYDYELKPAHGKNIANKNARMSLADLEGKGTGIATQRSYSILAINKKTSLSAILKLCADNDYNKVTGVFCREVKGAKSQVQMPKSNNSTSVVAA